MTKLAVDHVLSQRVVVRVVQLWKMVTLSDLLEVSGGKDKLTAPGKI